MQLKQRHHITKLFVDGANPEVIRELKRRIGEFEDYHYYTEEQLWLMRMGDMHTCQLPEKAQRDVAMDVYVIVQEVYQDTPIFAKANSIS